MPRTYGGALRWRTQMVSPLQISQAPTLLRFGTSFSATLGEVVLHWRLSPETCRQRQPVRLRRESKRYSGGSLESEKSLIPLIGSAAVSMGMKRGLASAERHQNHDRTCAWRELHADHMCKHRSKTVARWT
jgi:hypothetical protein